MWLQHMARECLSPVWWWQPLIWGVWRPPKSLGAIVMLICVYGVMVDWDSAVVSVLAFFLFFLFFLHDQTAPRGAV